MDSRIQLMLGRAISSFQNGSLEDAKKILANITSTDPKNPIALQILGLIHASQNEFDKAISFLKKAVLITPNDPSLHYNLAKCLSSLDKDLESLAHHQKCILLSPNNPEALLNYSHSYFKLGRYQEALETINCALSLSPNSPEALLNKGAIFKQLRNPLKALEFSELAIKLRNNYAEGWLNRGVALKDLGNPKEALLSYNEALRYSPEYADAWTNKGAALRDLGRYQEALEAFKKSKKIKPEDIFINSNILQVKLLTCDWNSLSASDEHLNQEFSKGAIITPFLMLALTESEALHQLAARSWANHFFTNEAFSPKPILSSTKKRIRIGYYSADLRNHPVSILLAGALERHNQNQFELFAFSYGPKADDQMRQRLIPLFSQFIDINEKTDFEVAKLSRELEIDIAVDLTGLTQLSRTGIFAYRAAPIQINYLGYPGTIGADFMDYLIADEIVIPKKSRKYYSEKIIYLPNAYQPNDFSREVRSTIPSRSDCYLPPSGFVFACFNNNYKIAPAIFSTWLNILKKVEGSVLWLLRDNPWAESNLKNVAESRGIKSDRIIFAPRIEPQEHLARHQLVGLFLDTVPYNAHTTASDALFMRIPLLTCLGRSFAGRVASSLLFNAGLPELITSSLEEYESRAIQLATNPALLSQIRSKLESNLPTSNLFNAELFAKHLEMGYLSAYQNALSGLPPSDIFVNSLQEGFV